MKVLFLGTPDFSVKVLTMLARQFEVVAVVTGLDKPSGRGKELKPSPVKECALAQGIPVLQYEKVSKEGIEDIKALGADIAVTAAFGQILSDEFLSLFPHGVLNVHASLLPRFRGPSPIQWAILSGDEETGITIMRTVKEVDAGDVLLKKHVKIGEKEIAGELFDRLSTLGGEAICEALELVKENKDIYTPQDHTKATFCKMISKSDGLIDFNKTYIEIDRHARGISPWPGAFTTISGKRLKVHEVEKASGSGKIGEVIQADSKNGLVIACLDGAVRLLVIQPDGKGIMKDLDYLRGNKLDIGERGK